MEFVKSVASGNDFVILDREQIAVDEVQWPEMVEVLCRSKYGIGADGVLVLYFGINPAEPNRVRMRIFNSDGSEAEMCGNGSRCAIRYSAERLGLEEIVLETLAGDVMGQYFRDTQRARVRLTRPKDLAKDIPLDCSFGGVVADYIDTGVPHTIVFVEDIDKIDVPSQGREIRYHSYFSPRGTNVDFVKILDANNIRIRTYERGVENETLACGTGSVAAAILSLLAQGIKEDTRVNVKTQGGEVLGVDVYFNETGEVWQVFLEGQVYEIFRGYTDIV